MVDEDAMVKLSAHMQRRIDATLRDALADPPPLGRVTIESIRNLLHPLRRRQIVFPHADDRAVVMEACQRLRTEGYELAERQSGAVEPGTAVVVDADLLQPPTFKGVRFDTWPDVPTC